MKSFFKLILFFIAFTTISPVYADVAPGNTPEGVSVAPIRIDLSPSTPTQAVTITNYTDKTSIFEIDVKQWSRLKGQDVYTDTRDLVTSPPIFKIAPGKSQVLRVALRKPNPNSDKETTYRIFFQEVQQQVNFKPQDKTIIMLLRLGVPVFVQPGKVVNQLNWKIQPAGNTLKVNITNSGNTHIQLNTLTAVNNKDMDHPIGQQKVAGYLFPGQSQDYTIKLTGAANNSTQVIASTNQGDLSSNA